jgi:hypothetical protein
MDGRIVRVLRKYSLIPGLSLSQPGDPFRFAKASPERFSCGECIMEHFIADFFCKKRYIRDYHNGN